MGEEQSIEENPYVGQLTFIQSQGNIEVCCVFGEIDRHGEIVKEGYNPEVIVHREASRMLDLWESKVQQDKTLKAVEDSRLINGLPIVNGNGKKHAPRKERN